METRQKQKKENTKIVAGIVPDQPSRPKLTLDVEKYQAMLDAPELSETEREEMLTSLWSMIVSFGNLGFEIAPEQSCGQARKSSALDAFAQAAVLNSEHPDTADAKEAADV